MTRLFSSLSQLEAYISGRTLIWRRRIDVLRKILEDKHGIASLAECKDGLGDVFVGVDSAYPSRPLELVGITLSAVVAGAVAYDSRRRRTRTATREFVVVGEYEEIDVDEVAAIARRVERELALAISRSLGAKTALLDGEIMPLKAISDTPRWDSVRARTLELLESLETVIGIVKRSFSRDLSLSRTLGINDKTLLSITLRRGEYIVIDHAYNILSSRGCKIVFYKPRRGLPTVVKAELCTKRKEIEDIVCGLDRETGPTGLPWIIDLVDSIVKSRVTTILRVSEARLRARLFSEAEAYIVALPANPQEATRSPPPPAPGSSEA